VKKTVAVEGKGEKGRREEVEIDKFGGACRS
jgi:hypothetical protein